MHDACFFDDQAKTAISWLGSSFCCIRQKLYLQMYVYFGLYKILLMEKTSFPWKTVKGTWNSFLLKKNKKFWENGIMKLPGKWQKVVEQNNEYIVL